MLKWFQIFLTVFDDQLETIQSLIRSVHQSQSQQTDYVLTQIKRKRLNESDDPSSAVLSLKLRNQKLLLLNQKQRQLVDLAKCCNSDQMTSFSTQEVVKNSVVEGCYASKFIQPAKSFLSMKMGEKGEHMQNSMNTNNGGNVLEKNSSASDQNNVGEVVHKSGNYRNLCIII